MFKLFAEAVDVAVAVFESEAFVGVCVFIKPKLTSEKLIGC